MLWHKLGKIFDVNNHGLDFDVHQYAQGPQAVVLDDYIRIYFSTRRVDPVNGKFYSDIAFIDMDKSFKNIIGHSQKPVIPLGGLGTFDEHGIFPISPMRHNGEIWAYTTGWSRRTSVSVETSTGLAISKDNGTTFERYGTGPVLTSSLNEPMLVGDSFVREFNGTYHMWYMFGKKWNVANENEPPSRVYKLAYASSPDGIHWHKEEAVQIVPDVLDETECQALPTVIKIGDRYHMYFCYRHSTDFRVNSERGYRLGYAWSDDLKNWTRDDAQGGLEPSEGDWDSDMMCYPNLFEIEGKIYLLYNGNEFGKHGLGIAELISV
jgi:sucrose-6-phosphate hydrolase SacC (GH32 family)